MSQTYVITVLSRSYSIPTRMLQLLEYERRTTYRYALWVDPRANNLSFFRRYHGGYGPFRKSLTTQFDVSDITNLEAQENPQVYELHLRPPFIIYDSGKKIEEILKRNGVEALRMWDLYDQDDKNLFCRALGFAPDSNSSLLISIMQTHTLYVLWMTSTPVEGWLKKVGAAKAPQSSSPAPHSSPSPAEKPRRFTRGAKRTVTSEQQS